MAPRIAGSHLEALEEAIGAHERALEYEATLPTNPTEFMAQERAEFMADWELGETA